MQIITSCFAPVVLGKQEQRYTGRITIAGNRNTGTSLNGPDAEEHNGTRNRQQYPMFI
jgi:hypothetical protein